MQQPAAPRIEVYLIAWDEDGDGEQVLCDRFIGHEPTPMLAWDLARDAVLRDSDSAFAWVIDAGTDRPLYKLRPRPPISPGWRPTGSDPAAD